MKEKCPHFSFFYPALFLCLFFQTSSTVQAADQSSTQELASSVSNNFNFQQKSLNEDLVGANQQVVVGNKGKSFPSLEKTNRRTSLVEKEKLVVEDLPLIEDIFQLSSQISLYLNKLRESQDNFEGEFKQQYEAICKDFQIELKAVIDQNKKITEKNKEDLDFLSSSVSNLRKDLDSFSMTLSKSDLANRVALDKLKALEEKIFFLEKKTDNEFEGSQKKYLVAVGLIGLLGFLLCLMFFLWRKKIKNVDSRSKQLSLRFEETILSWQETLEKDSIKIQSGIDSILSTQASLSEENKENSSITGLIKLFADRITFMQMTLYKMDKGTRGYKQLFKALNQMKDNLSAHGYEIVDLLGKPYHEGIKATASFIEDTSLPPGQHGFF